MLKKLEQIDNEKYKDQNFGIMVLKFLLHF